jgi:protein-L-isoaspartate(D-aspartate) O-methyltransferase
MNGREPERAAMVGTQVAGRGITDTKVLDLMRKVPRHLFAGPKHENEAYEDHPLPIGEGQTISQPYMVALMTQELGPDRGMKVLEIGTGSGYQTSLLAELAGEVFTVERHKNLSEKAQKSLKDLGYSNIRFKTGDGTLGWKENAPYDRIIVTAGSKGIPDALTEQLSQNNGIMILPVGSSSVQVLTKVIRKGNKIETSNITTCVFVPLVGKYGW